MSEVKVTLCLPQGVREHERPEQHGGDIRIAVYDLLNGSLCWAAVEYKLSPNSMGCFSMHFRLEGVGLPSDLRPGFDREPLPGVTFQPNIAGVLVPVISPA